MYLSSFNAGTIMLTRGVRLGSSVLTSSSFGEYFNDLLQYINKRTQVSRTENMIKPNIERAIGSMDCMCTNNLDYEYRRTFFLTNPQYVFIQN